MYSFGAVGVSRGLATKVSFTRVSREGKYNLLHEGGPASGFIFVLQYVIVIGLRFKSYTLYITFKEI
jgi:hypothetical protein